MYTNLWSLVTFHARRSRPSFRALNSHLTLLSSGPWRSRETSRSLCAVDSISPRGSYTGTVPTPTAVPRELLQHQCTFNCEQHGGQYKINVLFDPCLNPDYKDNRLISEPTQAFLLTIQNRYLEKVK